MVSKAKKRRRQQKRVTAFLEDEELWKRLRLEAAHSGVGMGEVLVRAYREKVTRGRG